MSTGGPNDPDLLKEIKADDGGSQVIMLPGVVNQSTILRAMKNSVLIPARPAICCRLDR